MFLCFFVCDAFSHSCAWIMGNNQPTGCAACHEKDVKMSQDWMFAQNINGNISCISPFYCWGANLSWQIPCLYEHWTMFIEHSSLNIVHWTCCISGFFCRMLWYGLLAAWYTIHITKRTSLEYCTLCCLCHPLPPIREEKLLTNEKYLIRLLVFMNTLVLWTRKKWTKEKVLCKEKLSKPFTMLFKNKSTDPLHIQVRFKNSISVFLK